MGDWALRVLSARASFSPPYSDVFFFSAVFSAYHCGSLSCVLPPPPPLTIVMISVCVFSLSCSLTLAFSQLLCSVCLAFFFLNIPLLSSYFFICFFPVFDVLFVVAWNGYCGFSSPRSEFSFVCFSFSTNSLRILLLLPSTCDLKICGRTGNSVQTLFFFFIVSFFFFLLSLFWTSIVRSSHDEHSLLCLRLSGKEDNHSCTCTSPLLFSFSVCPSFHCLPRRWLIILFKVFFCSISVTIFSFKRAQVACVCVIIDPTALPRTQTHNKHQKRSKVRESTSSAMEEEKERERERERRANAKSCTVWV